VSDHEVVGDTVSGGGSYLGRTTVTNEPTETAASGDNPEMKRSTASATGAERPKQEGVGGGTEDYTDIRYNLYAMSVSVTHCVYSTLTWVKDNINNNFTNIGTDPFWCSTCLGI